MLREAGDRLGRRKANETMKCPNCRTPMEEGLIDKSCFIQKQEPEPSKRTKSWAFHFFKFGRVRRVTAHRCPACTHVELTAP
ncbi:MAG: PF20097 family protein [Verrucomicrobiaceae bacterium]